MAVFTFKDGQSQVGIVDISDLVRHFVIILGHTMEVCMSKKVMRSAPIWDRRRNREGL